MALIGINGSGKTTLLKIISQVTYQSAGRCDVQGRIGALLSVTSGIQPELIGAGERLPLRRRPRHGPPEDPAAVRRDRRVRRAQRRHRSAGQVLLDGHADAARVLHRRLPRARRAPGRRGPRGRRRHLPAEVPQPDRRDRPAGHHPALRLPRPGLGRGLVRAGRLAGRRGGAGRRSHQGGGQPCTGPPWSRTRPWPRPPRAWSRSSRPRSARPTGARSDPSATSTSASR